MKIEMLNYSTYFVLNGLLNGEEGVYALTTGLGQTQQDGWYWIYDGLDDGKGPFESREAAKKDVENSKEYQEALKCAHLRNTIYNTGGFKTKARNWSEVGEPIPLELLLQLKVYSADELGMDTVLNTFYDKPEENMFIVEHNGGLYVVDTGGYNYARQIRYAGPSSMLPKIDGPVAEALEFVNKTLEKEASHIPYEARVGDTHSRHF